jgi:hypothetical protein
MAVLIDSEYLDSEIRTKLSHYMLNNSIDCAFEEYNGAIQDLTANDTKDAIVKAHKSVESVIKAVLNENNGTFGVLLSKLIKSGMIPEYYEEFLVHFEKMALVLLKKGMYRRVVTVKVKIQQKFLMNSQNLP